MHSQPYTFRAAAFLVLIKEGKVLLLRRANTGYEDGNYSLPAGHMDGNETVPEACAREAKEETSLEIDPGDLAVVHVAHHRGDSAEYFQFYCTTNKWQGEPYNAEPQYCSELAWYPLGQLPENTINYVRQALENIEKGICFSSFGF